MTLTIYYDPIENSVVIGEQDECGIFKPQVGKFNVQGQPDRVMFGLIQNQKFAVHYDLPKERNLEPSSN